MIAGLYTEQVQRTLREILCQHVVRVYDDPNDLDRQDVAKLERAGRFLGIDIWDRDVIYKIVGHRVAEADHERLRGLAER